MFRTNMFEMESTLYMTIIESHPYNASDQSPHRQMTLPFTF